ncbi:hypothetical protein HKX48_001220 [Thoreauomyces humboldtii]|nr:hypothetical protein HKX48_001220 [Thoreauomyces humboldtii]
MTVPPSPRKVEGGASLLVAYRIAQRKVLVVGGGKEASGRVFFALDADALVTLVCPRAGLNDEVATRIDNGELVHIDREFKDSDLDDDVYMVLGCIDAHEESRRIALLCRERRIIVNCADIPELCDFYFFAQHRDGPIQIGVSTNGCGPRMGAKMRDALVEALPDGARPAVEKIGMLRAGIREVDSKPENAPRRMAFLSRLCDSWTFKQIADLDSEATLDLLESYERGEKNPSPPSSQRRAANGTSHDSRARSATPQTYLEQAQGLANGLPLIGGMFGFATSATGAAWNLTSSTVSGAVGTATSIGSQALDITTTYVGAIQETGTNYAHYVKTRTEDVVETGLRTLPEPVSHVARAGLNLVPLLPIHVSRKPRGRLTLVGAGPGDPDLLTVRALDRIRTADLIVSDRLVPKPILDLVPPKKLHLVQRKADGKSDASQSDANETCRKALERGLDVVRLKGGDPFLFGRGAEEILHFRGNGGYDTDVVPGISSCIAAPASLDIPVTHRGVADQLLVLSGRGENGAFPTVPAHNDRRTTVILMSVSRLEGLVGLMLDAGYPKELPAAVVEKGCWGKEEERCIQGTLADISAKVAVADVGTPALLVVGGAVEVLRGLPTALIDEIDALDLD